MHPRLNAAPLVAHDQRQCVECNKPGHNGRFLGPRLPRECGWGAAYLTRMKHIVSDSSFAFVSHLLAGKPERVMCFTPLIVNPQIMRARRPVTIPLLAVSVMFVSTQSPRR